MTQPLVPPLLCCNKPPPGCGYCWYCGGALKCEIDAIAARMAEASKTVGWPRVLADGDVGHPAAGQIWTFTALPPDPMTYAYAAGWRQWKGTK